MPPTFYLAPGRDATLRDIDVALAVGQRHFLVPIGSRASRYLRELSDIHVVLDSGAWPIDNPRRPSFEQWLLDAQRWHEYAEAHAPDNGAVLDFVVAYDHIGDPGRTQDDYRRAMGARLWERFPKFPFVPVHQYPSPAFGILLDFEVGWAGTRFDMVDSDGTLDRPAYAVGGLVPHSGTTHGKAWLAAFLAELWNATSEGWTEDDEESDGMLIDPAFLQFHILGIARPDWVLHPLVGSFDTSGPCLHAGYGWKKIAPSYREDYGLPVDLLQRSRLARVAYWMIHYRSRIGLDWYPVDPAWLEQLPAIDPVVKTEKQLTLFDLAA